MRRTDISSSYWVIAEPFFSRFLGIETNEALYEKAIADLSKKLDVYDKILAKQKYLAGDVSGRIHWVQHGVTFFDRKLLSRTSTISLMGCSSDLVGSTSWRQDQTSIGLYLHFSDDIQLQILMQISTPHYFSGGSRNCPRETLGKQSSSKRRLRMGELELNRAEFSLEFRSEEGASMLHFFITLDSIWCPLNM